MDMEQKTEYGYDENFWDSVNRKDSIRSAVSDFMENDPVLTKLEGTDWFAVEDGIKDLIEGLKDKIFEERLYEILRKHFYSYISDFENDPGDWYLEYVYKSFPVEAINILLSETYERMMTGDPDYGVPSLDNFIDDHTYYHHFIYDLFDHYGMLNKHKKDEVEEYVEYLKRWYDGGSRAGLQPLTIESYLASKEIK